MIMRYFLNDIATAKISFVWLENTLKYKSLISQSYLSNTQEINECRSKTKLYKLDKLKNNHKQYRIHVHEESYMNCHLI